MTSAWALAGVLAVVPARAAQWFAVASPGVHGAQTLVEVDLETVRPHVHGGEGVIRVSYETVQRHDAGFDYRSFVGNAQFDCPRRSVVLTSAAYYPLPGGQGERVGADSAGRESGMPPALLRSIPVSTQRALLRATCATVPS